MAKWGALFQGVIRFCGPSEKANENEQPQLHTFEIVVALSR